MDDRFLFILAIVLLMVPNSKTVITSSHQPDNSSNSTEEPPEGYYAFIESPGAEPPKVRRPPYVQSDMECPGLKKNKGKMDPQTYKMLSLCGNLNKGYIPKNPMNMNVLGSAYPFELIRNKTLQFFSKSLPILKADDTLPKVAKYQFFEENNNKIAKHLRIKRSFESNTTAGGFPSDSKSKRTARKFCDNNDGVTYVSTVRVQNVNKIVQPPNHSTSLVCAACGEANYKPRPSYHGPCLLYLHLGRSLYHGPCPNIYICSDRCGADHTRDKTTCLTQSCSLCLLYKAFQGDSVLGAQTFHDRKDEVKNETPEYRRGETTIPAASKENSLPPTPCPAKVEYVTPVFARNYQGVWRYVVQIPYEGYFTQTIEVTRCLNARCHYIEGSCISSPRWISVLVAEIYYPNTYLPSKPAAQLSSSSSWPGQSHRLPVSSENPPPVQDFQNYQQYLQKRAGISSGSDNFESPTINDSKKPMQCDGVDEIGCFQVRLYYDWFLVPGSCKCWKPDYFSRYMRRKPNLPEL